MKLIRLSAIALLLSILTNVSVNAQPVPFTDKRWAIQSQGSLIEFYKGYQSLYLSNGIAYLKDEKFLNGIIEFDMYMQERVSFSGVIFRLQNPTNFEELYFRSQLSGMPDAYQYTPVFNGNSAWQLYHDQFDGLNDGFIHWQPIGENMGYNKVLDYVYDRWIHVKLVVNGTRAELFLDNATSPSAFIKELKRGSVAGSIGFRSNIGAGRFANFSIAKMDDPEIQTREPVNLRTLPGTISKWQVSTAFKEALITNNFQLDPKWMNNLKWQTLTAEKKGITNISATSPVTDSTNTVLTKLVISSDKDQVKKLDIGFSDRVIVFCNGQPVYNGNATYRSRDYRYLGTIGWFDAVFLPLKKGENTIILAVSETFGGWGVMGKIDNRDGIKILE